MPRYAFQARDSEGRSMIGHRDAASASDVAQELSAAGITPLTIELYEEVADAGLAVKFSLFEKKVSIDEIILFSHQMFSLTKAGISVAAALRGLGESQANEVFKEVLLKVAGYLEAGADLATSLRRYPNIFSELYASVIHVGENTGRMEEAFKQIALSLEMERETKKRIVAATRYPMFVLGAIGIALVILNIFVIPSFAAVFAKFQAELPWQTRMLIAVSDFFVAYWWLMLGLLVCLIFVVRRYIASPEGRFKWDRLKLKLPILGSIFERINLARFCQTFAMISRSGLPISQGLHVISRAVGNEYHAHQISGMRAGLERGESIAQTARESGMFTPVVLQMIAVGEETGSIDELLEQAAGFYEEEVDFELKALTSAIEPILIISIGIMVLVLALGVFLPLWDLSSVANR